MSDLLHALGFIMLFGSVFISIICLEAWYWHRKGRKDAYHLKETLTNIATGGIYKIFDGIAIALFIQAFYEFVAQYGFQYKIEDGLLSYLFLFIACDFFFYIYHYGMHKIRWLWSIHVTHHSSKIMNFSTALRQNFLMDVNFGWMIWWLPLAIIGFDKDLALIAIELSLSYQFFLHTELIGRLGVFEKVFNTPSHHRVHHGCKPEQIDTNFGGVLIIWDRLFGTFVDERDAGKVVYGLTERQPTTLNPIRLNLDEFIQMFKDVIQYRDLKIFYKSPAYVNKYQSSNLHDEPRDQTISATNVP
ncbi:MULTISPECIES: sterol desaturase family protein [unclassified Oleiphilus]|nr:MULTISPECIES: sterol desaturase family protein [unclassified Oleiphilus]